MTLTLVALAALLIAVAPVSADGPPSLADQADNSWVKRSPLPDAPPSPRKGYESSMDYDPYLKRLIRHGGHNQGGGGAQHFETWMLDPTTMKWELRHTNTSPPGVCCCKDNVYSRGLRRYVRFPAFSLSHGWQWNRMVYTRNFTAWSYDPAGNQWRNMRPLPQRSHGPGRQATYDPDNDTVVLFSSQGQNSPTSVYDLYTNTWHAMDPAGSPPSRCYAGFAYDQHRKQFVLFGAHYKDDPRTWHYDLRANKWTAHSIEPRPPSNRTTPVMAYDTNNQVMLAVMRSGQKDGTLQTWIYDPANHKWTRPSPEGDIGSSGSRNRILVYLPDHNVFVMENRADNQQQIWTYRYRKVDLSKQPPARPTEVAVTVDAYGKATLTWKPGDDPAVAEYRVLRGVGDTPWTAEFKPIARGLKETRLVDDGLERGKIHYYRVTAVDGRGREGLASIPVRTQPRALDYAVVSVLGEKEVEVAWDASAH
jgi:hypothetical protein